MNKRKKFWIGAVIYFTTLAACIFLAGLATDKWLWPFILGAFSVFVDRIIEIWKEE